MAAYENLGRIGEGTYGVVLKCRHKVSGELVAIKRFKEGDDDEQVSSISLQIAYLLATGTFYRLLMYQPWGDLQEALSLPLPVKQAKTNLEGTFTGVKTTSRSCIFSRHVTTVSHEEPGCKKQSYTDFFRLFCTSKILAWSGIVQRTSNR